MGFGLPAAIGAAFANPDKRVICLSGDGSFQMCTQELMTAKVYGQAVITDHHQQQIAGHGAAVAGDVL